MKQSVLMDDVERDLPSDWGWVPLKRSARVVMGQSPPSSDYNEAGFGPAFLQGNAEFGDRFPTPRLYCETSSKWAKAGDLLLSVRAPVGALNEADRRYGIGRGLCAIRPRGGLDRRFLFHFLDAIGQDALKIEATGSTYEAVSSDDVAALPTPLPPLPTQRAIASFLDRETGKIDTLIEKKRRLLDLLEEKRTALITRAVTRGLDPDVPMKDSGVEWLGEIPEHWEVVRTKHLLSFVTSGSRGWSKYFSKTGPLFLQSRNLDGRGGIDVTDVERVRPPDGAEGRRTLVAPDDILVCITGALTGNASLVPAELGEAYVSQHLALLRVAAGAVDVEYLFWALRSVPTQLQIDVLQYGGTKQGLGLDDVRDLMLVLPTKAEQEAIVSELKEMLAHVDKLVERITYAISLLQEYRTSLISHAVTGKIELSDVP